MKRSKAIFVRLCTIMLVITLCLYLYNKELVYTSLFVFLIFTLLIIELFYFIKNTFLFYDKTIQAILQNDFSSDFSKHKSYDNYSSLFTLYEKLKHQQNNEASKNIIYSSIFNSIETGILILQKDSSDWNIFLMNDYFSKHFEVPKVSKWHYLKNQLPSLCSIIEAQNFEELKTTLEIKVNQQDQQTFVMQSSRSKSYNQEYYIVLLDSIQKVIEKKEKEAWINLMKIISHELMNSLTPIRSLSQNLHELVQQESLSKEDLEDMKQSVFTMLNRSNHLQEFVESYRKLAMLPSPQKEKIKLSEIIESSLQIMNPIFKQNKIELQNTITFNRVLYVDKLQLEQVFINLFTNSIYALKEKENKQIILSASVKENRTFITITDTGYGVEKEIEDKIFLPFFTTRKDGAGIGLTLSKNIIEAHGGYLAFQNGTDSISFIICLIH
jgi:two-component system nitrogen regulation sensor histidine kinase NtrY